MQVYTKRALRFGQLYSLVGLGVGLFITVTSAGDYSGFFIFAAAGGFAAQFLCWRFIVERRGIDPARRYKTTRTVLTGAFGGLLSHYLCWYFYLVVANIQYWISGTGMGSLGEAPMDLFTGLGAMWLHTLFSWLFYGWVTVPLGALMGALYGRKLKNAPEI